LLLGISMPLPETIPRAHPRQEAQAHLLPTQQRKRKLPQPLPYGLRQRIRQATAVSGCRPCAISLQRSIHPGTLPLITVYVVESDAKDTVTQDVEGAADVYMFANDNLTSLIAANGISKLGGQTVEEVKENNSQAIVDSVSVDGDIYGVPFTTNTWFMYYDKSAFTEDEVKNLDTMIAKDKISFPITNSWYIASFYVANGCTLFGEDGTDEAAGVDFEGDKAKAVTDYLVDLVNNPNFVSDARRIRSFRSA